MKITTIIDPMKTKGVVLIAAGHPYYGNMAYNLALGIKLYAPEIPIAILHDGKGIAHLNTQSRYLFELHELPEFAYKHGDNISFFRAKTMLYDLTPFDETIFLDADMAWHKGRNINDLFALLKDTDFSMTNEGHIDFGTGENTISRNYQFWAKPDAIKSAYAKEKGMKDAKLFQFRSEFIYFKKTAANKKFFALARKIYDNPNVESVMFGNVLPDEIAFDIAAAVLHHYPHKDIYSPIFWEYLYGFLRYERRQLFENYFASSMGGRQVKQVQKDLYDDLVKYYYQQNGLSTADAHLWIDKRQFDSQRQAI